VLVIHGENDAHTSVTRGIALAEHTGGRLVLLEGSFHAPHVLHENPEQKRAAYVWLTDFVGWLPIPEPDGGDREAYLTADYNAEMIEHIARFPGCATGPCSSATRPTSCPAPSGPSYR
jgi:hypothetical protein